MLTVDAALEKLSLALDGDITPGTIPPDSETQLAKKINKALEVKPNYKNLAVKMADSASAVKLLLQGGIKSEPHLNAESPPVQSTPVSPRGSAPSVASLILGLQGNPEMQQKLLATVNPRLHALYSALTSSGGI
jgi:hypothetical protein